jgi:hypothetical protein
LFRGVSQDRARDRCKSPKSKPISGPLSVSWDNAARFLRLSKWQSPSGRKTPQGQKGSRRTTFGGLRRLAATAETPQPASINRLIIANAPAACAGMAFALYGRREALKPRRMPAALYFPGIIPNQFNQPNK